jgi:hypothetical protein
MHHCSSSSSSSSSSSVLEANRGAMAQQLHRTTYFEVWMSVMAAASRNPSVEHIA